MRKQAQSRFLILAALLVAGIAQAEQEGPPKASIDQLAWMTGAWQGPTGENAVLQETWLEPAEDSMMAAVRMLEDGKTGMVELIVIEEANDTLVFRLQQWSKSFERRLERPQRMVLQEIGERRVQFVAEDEETIFRTLAYSSSSPEDFKIELELREPPVSTEINLKAR